MRQPVLSAVAHDARNDGLMKSLQRSTGIADIRSDWQALFPGRARFGAFTHQECVAWVETRPAGEWAEWRAYVRERYGL